MKKLLIVLLCLAVIAGVVFICYSCATREKGEDKIVNLTYDGEVITWSSVNKAKTYKINVDGTQAVVNQMDGKVAYRYDAQGKDFSFSIEAVIKEGSEENPKYTITFQNIGTVKDVAVKNGAVTWSNLAEAEKYQVMYNGDIVSELVGTESYPITAGEFTVKVRPMAGLSSADGNNPYYSQWCEPVSGTMLSAPENFKYDSEKFTWDKVNGATSYVVVIGSEELPAESTQLAYNSATDSFTASVYAVGDEANKVYSSESCKAQEYTYIKPVEGLQVVDGKVIWNASEGAVKYRLKINGIIMAQEITATEYVPNGTNFRIQVLPIGKDETCFSRWSEELLPNILQVPTVKGYTDGNILWNAVQGSAGYSIKVEKDGKVLKEDTVGSTTQTYAYNFPEVGLYSVYVKANAPADGGLDSSTWSREYKVTRLAAPKEYTFKNQPLEQNQVAVEFTPVTGASRYELLANGISVATANSKANTFLVDIKAMSDKLGNESVINFEIKAVGTPANASGATLDCVAGLQFNVTRLATPQNVTLSGNQITWDAVNNTSKYVVTVGGKRSEIVGTTFTLTNISTGKLDIYVQAMGDGDSVITSAFSNSVSITKLAKPAVTGIKNGNLTWNTVSGATAYMVQVGSQEYSADTTAFDLTGYLSTIPEGEGTQISVYAIGNGEDIVDSDVSDTRTISRYTRPATVSVMGDNLAWGASSVDSINCNEYKIVVTKDGAPIDDIKVSGTTYSMSKFDAGVYTVSIVAVGNLETTLDSPESSTYTFTKLGDITNFTKADGTYTWDEVPFATGYQIKLSDDAEWTNISTATYTPEFTHEGEFKISIRAIGNGVDVIDSNIFTDTQRVRAITTPVYQEEMTNVNAFKVEVSGSSLTIYVKKPEGANGCKLIVGGIEVDSTTFDDGTQYTFYYTMTTVGADYNIQVQIIGGAFNEAGEYILDSNPSTEYPVEYTA